MSLYLTPVSFEQACAFVTEHHRHHQPPAGHKFSVGVARDGVLCGVAIVGRPVSRVLQAEGDTLEVIRTATDGTRNANSMLYGAAWRATRALGYRRLIVVGERRPRKGWDVPSRPRDLRGTENVARTLWEVSA